MVVIRMSRCGAKRRPFYRIVVTDSRRARDGRPIERIGFFNPLAKENEEKMRIDIDRVRYWLSVGARMSLRVGSLVKHSSQSV